MDEYLGEFVTVVDGKISVKDTVMIAEKLVEEISFLKESMRHLIESMDNDEEIVYPKKDKKNKEKKNKKEVILLLPQKFYLFKNNNFIYKCTHNYCSLFWFNNVKS